MKQSIKNQLLNVVCIFNNYLKKGKCNLQIESFTKNHHQENFSINSLNEKIKNCTKCRLFRLRKNPFITIGKNPVKLMIISDFPEKEQDLLNNPFEGNTGKLFLKMMSAIDLKTEDFIFTFLVKCHPFNKNSIQSDEIKSCYEHILNELTYYNPKIIILLGQKVSQLFLDSSSLGVLINKHNRLWMAISHPRELIENNYLKIDAWKHLQILKKILN